MPYSYSIRMVLSPAGTRAQKRSKDTNLRKSLDSTYPFFIRQKIKKEEYLNITWRWQKFMDVTIVKGGGSVRMGQDFGQTSYLLLCTMSRVVLKVFPRSPGTEQS